MRKRTRGDWSLDLVIYGSLLVAALITLLPFANVLSKSVSAEWAVVSGKVGIYPIGFQLETMKFVVTSHEFQHAFLISVLVTVVGTLLSILITSLTAYPLSKRHLPGIGVIMVLFVFTMMFNGGIIPNYLLMKQLHLINSLWSLVLPAMISVFNLLVVKSYFETVPEALEESARIDGARNLTVLFRIILPISMPVLATIALFYAVYYWNDFFHPMMYLNSPNLKPLQLHLRDMVMEASAPVTTATRSADDILNVSTEGIRAATIIASTIPILLVYPYLQKYFIKGVMIGSVKG
ncbi:carbohydrate ABC transporter permease [Paenibacillus cymbidii]|uniref:carbohydrate ABC transporter permease n=1 Tax=Paenibacillus cymbidii TaxID=1639034 RepID=UPI00107FE6D9|nr:carbohydrate ABC transporter permease [Paenibacillus cymbidii]